MISSKDWGVSFSTLFVCNAPSYLVTWTNLTFLHRLWAKWNRQWISLHLVVTSNSKKKTKQKKKHVRIMLAITCCGKTEVSFQMWNKEHKHVESKQIGFGITEGGKYYTININVLPQMSEEQRSILKYKTRLNRMCEILHVALLKFRMKTRGCYEIWCTISNPLQLPFCHIDSACDKRRTENSVFKIILILLICIFRL